MTGRLDINVELSGGIRDDASLAAALATGCARVNIGTAALEDPDWVRSAIARHGDRIAVGLDVRGTTLAARGWTSEGGDLWETLDRLDADGCARYVVTDVTKDGTLRGPNLDLLREVCARTSRPVVASGGSVQPGRPARDRRAGAARRRGRHRRQGALRGRVQPGRGAGGGGGMTVAVRVIPCLDVDGGRVVKGVNFRDLRDAGDPVELAAAYDAEGADELTFLDITASSGGRETTYDVVRRTAEQVFIPLTVGGGVRSVDDVDRLLRAGADKVSLNTAAIARPGLLAEAAAAVRLAVRGAVRGRAPFHAPARGPRRSPAERVRGHHARRPARHRHRRGGLGAPRRRAGRGRDPAQLDGRGRYRGRLRPGADPRGPRRGDRAGDRQRRRGRRRRTSRRPSTPGADAVLAASVFHFGKLRIAEVKEALPRGRPPRPLTRLVRKPQAGAARPAGSPDP